MSDITNEIDVLALDSACPWGMDMPMDLDASQNVDLVSPADEVEVEDAPAIAAGRLVTADRLGGEQRIYRVIEAARLIEAVPRAPGTRTSSTRLTRYQAVLKAVGITRETAREWKAALDAEPIAAQYLADCRTANPPREPTLAGLLDAWTNHNAVPAGGAFTQSSANIPVNTTCPKCGYEWAGAPKCKRCEECPKCGERWFK